MNTSIGLSNPWIADYAASSGTVTYSNAKSLGMATEFSITAEGADPAVLYADNGPAESSAVFGGGEATVGIHKLTLETLADLLGQEYASSTGAVFKSDATAPYKGLGVVSMDISGGEITYSVILLYKVQCQQPDVNRVTNGETVEYQVPSLQFSILRDDTADSKWMFMQDGFETEAAAVAALKAKLGVS